jgi:cation-transporting P-type ATPase 13A2
MATGDNTLTGINNAQKWGMLTSSEYLIGSYSEVSGKIVWKYKSIRPEDLVSSTAAGEEDPDESEDDMLTHEQQKERIRHILQDSDGDSNLPLHEFITNNTRGIQVAMEGTAFQFLLKMRDIGGKIDSFPADEVLLDVLKYGKVFSRMSPKQKALLVEEYQKSTGEIVGMCGDGANDWSALKAADVGLSLSEAEASIVAPFTSKTPDISSWVNLMILGRASLDLSYELFKYLMVYIQIQFGSAWILFFKTCNYDDKQMLFFDLGGVVPITILLCWTQANDILIEKRPVSSLFKRSILWDVIGQGQIQFWWFFGMYFTLRGQGFYEETQGGHDETTDGMETTTALLFTFPQYIFIGIAFHTATQFRKQIYTNIPFMCLLTLQFWVAGWIILGPQPWMRSTLEIAHMDFYFRYIILGGALLNGFFTICYEQFIIRVFGKREMEEEIVFKIYKPPKKSNNSSSSATGSDHAKVE